ncbi:MAG: hypothetical protein H0W02_23055 [Ktedonobacteraceae bacterium]|nr:hypothetical protein [Ktedonobacteraceae bacterium]
MTQQECEIVLSPNLPISPTEFAAAWNELADTRTIGEAHVEQTRGEMYDPTLVATILITVVGGVATNVISACIMKVLEKPGKPVKHTHIEHVKKPDGTDSFIVDIDE